MKNLIRNFALFFIAFLVIAAIISSFSSKQAVASAGIETLIQQINSDQVNAIVVDGNNLKVDLKNNQKEVVKKEGNDSLSTLLSNFKVDPTKTANIKISVKDVSGWDYILANILPYLIPLVLIGGFLFFMMRGVQGANSKAMSFGQSTAKDFAPDEKNRHKTSSLAVKKFN